jgi:adenylate cyclase class IV
LFGDPKPIVVVTYKEYKLDKCDKTYRKLNIKIADTKETNLD